MKVTIGMCPGWVHTIEVSSGDTIQSLAKKCEIPINKKWKFIKDKVKLKVDHIFSEGDKIYFIKPKDELSGYEGLTY